MKSLLGTAVPADFVDRLMTEISQENLRADLVAALNPPAPVRLKKTRTKRPWQPTDRERAILNLPPSSQMKLEEYCKALDHAGVPFPEKWQKKGWPQSHREAWESKDDQLRDNIKSERRNVWNRLKTRG
jgi:hypothetical protein